MLRRWVVAAAGMASACALLVNTDDLGGGGPLPDDGGGDAIATADSTVNGSADATTNDATNDTGPVTKAYVAAVLADGPIAYYRFEESSGTVAKTEVGSVNGVYTGELTLGAPGAFDGSTGIALDGGSGGVSLGLAFDFVGTTPFSLEAWYLPTSYASDYRFLLSKDAKDDAGRETYGIWFSGNYNAMLFERYVNGVQGGAGASVPTKGTFHHLVATYDGTMASLFLDGTLVDAKADNRASPPKPVPFWIGRQASEFFALNGVIDEVAIYDKALSAARILAHFQAVTP